MYAFLPVIPVLPMFCLPLFYHNFLFFSQFHFKHHSLYSVFISEPFSSLSANQEYYTSMLFFFGIGRDFINGSKKKPLSLIFHFLHPINSCIILNNMLSPIPWKFFKLKTLVWHKINYQFLFVSLYFWDEFQKKLSEL